MVFSYKLLLIFGLIISANFVFNYSYFGDLLPQTLTVKMNHGKSGLWGLSHSFVLSYNFLFKIAFNNQAFFVITIVTFGLIGFANHIKEKLPLVLFINTLAITVFHTALNIQSYHWYYSMHFLTLVIFVCYGIIDIVHFVLRRYNNIYFRYAFLILLFIYPSLTQIELFRLLNRETPMIGYKSAGEWLYRNSPVDSKVACIEIGHIGWYSKRYIVDILGLVNPELGVYLGKHDFTKWYDIYKPDYIVVHEPMLGAEFIVQDYLNKGYYEKDAGFQLQGFAILKKTGKN
jgi:hypothetical protein